MACGGEPGARLAQRLQMPASPDTLLRTIRRCKPLPTTQVRVLGVDDWAIRRGHHYGTILVDLEEHKVMDLLPDRAAESFAAWLAHHPEVEIVSRDRGENYSLGANAGAPQAVQVADRWHLLRNSSEALIRVLEPLSKERSQVVSQMVKSEVPILAPDPPVTTSDEPAPPAKLTCTEEERRRRRARWTDKYARVVELRQQKNSIRAIARELELDRGTVHRWIKTAGVPERSGQRRRKRVYEWVGYLETRWNAGCHNAAALLKELEAQGFTPSYDSIRRFVASWRLREPTTALPIRPPLAGLTPSAKSVAWWLVKDPADRTSEQKEFVELFTAACPLAGQAAALAREFMLVIRNRSYVGFKNWLAKATAPDAIPEIRRFAKGLTNDLAAVEAALLLPWSNGQTEGQVNRLKLVKRQMFGRAKFDLLRSRVLGRRE